MSHRHHHHHPEDYGKVRKKINMRNAKFNIHWRDIERWAWEGIKSERVLSKVISEKYLPGAVGRLGNGG